MTLKTLYIIVLRSDKQSETIKNFIIKSKIQFKTPQCKKLPSIVHKRNYIFTMLTLSCNKNT